MTIKNLMQWFGLLLLSTILVLTGCSDDDDDYVPPPTQTGDTDTDTDVDTDTDTDTDTDDESTAIAGTAAAGAPMKGFVAVKDSDGTIRTADIGEGGAFSLDTEGLTPPFLMYASGLAGGRAFTLYAAGTVEDVGETVNITPLTDLVLANLVGTDTEEFFNNPDFEQITKGSLQDQADALVARLQPMIEALGISVDEVDILNGVFEADHTGIDAVLDMVEVTVDPDTNQATIVNRLDPTQTITDDLTDQNDNEVLQLGSATDAGTAATDLQALAQTLDEFAALVEAGVPTEAEVAPYLDDALLHMGFSRDDLLGLFTATDGEDREDAVEFSGELASFTLVAIDSSSDPKSATLDYGDSSYMVVRNAGEGWKLYGNQQLWGAWVETETHQTGDTFVSEVLVDAEGDVFEATDYMIVEGKGLPAGGVHLVQYDFNDPANDPTPGEFSSVGVDGLNPSDAVIDTMVAREPYTFTRWSDPNGDSDPEVAATLADDVQAESYEAVLRLKPLKSTGSVNFPTITDPTAQELSNFAGGDLSMAWTLPPGSVADEVTLFVTYDGGEQDRTDVEVEADATSAEITGISFTGTVAVLNAYLFAQDVYGRTLGTGVYVEIAP